MLVRSTETFARFLPAACVSVAPQNNKAASSSLRTQVGEKTQIAVNFTYQKRWVVWVVSAAALYGLVRWESTVRAELPIRSTGFFTRMP